MSAYVEKYRRNLKNLPGPRDNRFSEKPPIIEKSRQVVPEKQVNIFKPFVDTNTRVKSYTEQPIVNIGNKNIQFNLDTKEAAVKNVQLNPGTKYQGCLGCAGGRTF